MKKPTNKERDAVISHLMTRMGAVEQISQTAIDLLEHFIIYKEGDKKKFTNYLEERHKEALKYEQENLRQENEPADNSNQKNERQRAKGIRSKRK
jgi:hypothetical protein